MRVENSLKNVTTALVCQLLALTISFISRSIFVFVLGKEYLGINGLFTNILSVLSLAEIGFGTAIIYSLYKPIAENDESKIIALMSFYKKAYKGIGIFIFIAGIILIPFLPIFINDINNINNINLIYFLFLINSVISYFFAYKKSIIIANQKNYLVTFYKYIFYIFLNILQICILFLSKSFILYLIIQIIFTFAENYTVSLRADKMYPYLRRNIDVKLNEIERQEIFKNIKALIYHKIGGTIVNGTDNLVISYFVGVISVGLYSNYFMIINALNIIINQIFSSLTATIGNLNVKESKEKSFEVYQIIYFINFMIVTISSACILFLINPFIELWLGNEYLLSTNIIFILVLNFYISNMRKCTLIYKESMGLFWQDRYKPLVEGILNLIISMILARKLGIVGVFLGTMISSLLTCFWIEPFVLFKYGFNRSISEYYKSYLKYSIFTFFTTTFIYILHLNICIQVTWINLFITASVICLGIFITILILFRNKKEVMYLVNIIINLSKKCYKKIINIV